MEQVIPAYSKRMTLEEYLRMEESSDVKHEYRYGKIIDMAGGSPEHADIAANLISELKARRQADGIWAIGPSFDGLETSLKLRSLEITIPLVEIYAGVDLSQPPQETSKST